MSNQEERDIEEKIDAAMSRIDSETAGESAGSKRKRSARPQSGTPQKPSRSLKGASQEQTKVLRV